MAGTPASLVMCPGWPGVVGQSGGRFSLPSYLASVSGSLWDFTKTDDQFQEATGSTPADTIGQSIGLKLDRGLWGGRTFQQVVAVATELLTPGSWLMSTAGGTSTAVENPAGTLTLTGDGTNAARGDQSFATVAGRTYRVAFNAASNGVSILIGTAQGLQNIFASSPGVGARFLFFTATSSTTWIRFSLTGAATTVVSAISCKLIPGYHATQSSASLKPTYQLTGGKCDGTDDNLLTSYLAAAGANFVVALVTVPATLSASQLFVGASGAGPSARCYLQFTTGGLVAAGVGNLASGDGLIGTTDWRNQEVVVGLSFDGTSIRIFDGLTQISVVQSGTPTTSVPFRLGGQNFNGTAANFFSGSIKKLAAGYDFLTLARYNQIRTALLAA